MRARLLWRVLRQSRIRRRIQECTLQDAPRVYSIIPISS